MKVLKIECFRKVLIFKVALICLIYLRDGFLVDYLKFKLHSWKEVMRIMKMGR